MRRGIAGTKLSSIAVKAIWGTVNRYIINHQAIMTGWAPRPGREPLQVLKRLPGYESTPLHGLPTLAGECGVQSLLVKEEGDRFGLPAFKILGTSWAVYRLIAQRLGEAPEPWTTLEQLRAFAARVGPMTLITASDGNHGRGMARVASWMGWKAVVLMPSGTATARIEAIRGEGADVEVIDGSHDDAIRLARRRADGSTSILVQDSSWDGYETIPGWIVEGYSTLLWEIDDALGRMRETGPDLVLVPVGTGALAGAVIRHYRREGYQKPPLIIGVEPLGAECALESLTFDEVVTVPGQADTIMAGLNCGTLASIVWPYVRDGMDAVIAIDDEWAKRAMVALAKEGLVAGESGAAATGALLALMKSPDMVPLRQHFGIGKQTRVLTLVTEGITDPEMYARIVPGEHAGSTRREKRFTGE